MKNFSSSLHPALSVSSPEIVERVQSRESGSGFAGAVEKLAGSRLSSTGHSQEAPGAPLRSGSPGLAHRGRQARSHSPQSFLPSGVSLPRLPQVNQKPVSTSRAGRASPSHPCLHKAAGRAPAAAYPPAELGCALHAW